MESRRKRLSNLEDICPALRDLIARGFDKNDESIFPAWRRYLADRNQDDFKLICAHYMPLTVIIFRHFLRRHHRFFTEEIGVYISDAMIALASQVRFTKEFDPEAFYARCWAHVRWGIVRAHDERTGEGRCRAQKYRLVRWISSRLWSQLGREPTKDEIRRGLEHAGKRPQFYEYIIDNPDPQKLSLDAELSPDGRKMQIADASAADPSWRMVDSETVRLAMKGLKDRDRRLLRAVMRGDSGAVIAKRMRISRERVRQLINRVLWEARCRADLANYLGVLPDTDPPPKTKSGMFINFPSKPPPAPIAA